MLTGRTRQGKLVHFPAGTDGRDAGARRVGPGHGDRRAPPPPLRPPGGGDGAAPASRAHPGGERVTAVALVGVTASGKSATALELARRRGDCEIVSVDSMCVYRGMDIGTSKPDPRRGPPCRTICSTWSTRTRTSPSPQFQQAARDGAGRHRGTRAPRAAGRGHRALPARRWSTTSPSRAAIPTWPRRSRRSWTRAAPGRPTCTPGWPRSIRWPRRAWSRPTGGGSSARSRSRSGRAGPSPTFGPGLEAYPAERHDAGRPRPCARRGRPAHRRALRGAWSRRAWSTRCGRWPPGPPGMSRTARQALGLPGAPGPRGGGRTAGRLPGGGGAADPPVRPAPGLVVPPRPADRAGPASGTEAQALLEEALAVHG